MSLIKGYHKPGSKSRENDLTDRVKTAQIKLKSILKPFFQEDAP